MLPGLLLAAAAVETSDEVLLLMLRSSAAAGPASRTQAAPDATRRMVTGSWPPKHFIRRRFGGAAPVGASRAVAWQNANAEKQLAEARAVLPHVQSGFARPWHGIKFSQTGPVWSAAWMSLRRCGRNQWRVLALSLIDLRNCSRSSARFSQALATRRYTARLFAFFALAAIFQHSRACRWYSMIRSSMAPSMMKVSDKTCAGN